MSPFDYQTVSNFQSIINYLTPIAVLCNTPQLCIGGSPLQHCNALQYIALYYNVAQAVIHAVKRRPAGLRGVSMATHSAGLRGVNTATPYGVNKH